MSARSIVTQVRKHASAATRAVVDFCYPTTCVVCQATAAPGQRWCESCDLALEDLQFAPSCGMCAMPLAEHLAPCPYCEGKGLRPFDRIARLGVFEWPLRDLVLRVKYSNDWSLGEHLAERLAQQDSVQAILDEQRILIPVPLYWRRHALRGFNQAETIARVLARRCGGRVRQAVMRLRDTPTQTSLHKRAQRLENLANAFGATDPAAIKGQHVVLVDDVVTTAATLQTLAREVRRHGPASVSAIVMSIADPKGRAFEKI